MTRSEILNTAAQIFSQKGYHGTSMQDIALAVHLQKASLYHHVSSKQEILFELLNLGLDLLTSRVESSIEGQEPANERLHKAICTYLNTLADHQELASVLLFEYRSLEPQYLDRHIPRRDRFERLWRDLIREGVDGGVFSCNHPSLSARALLGILNWTVTWFRADGTMTADEIAEHLSSLFLLGLSSRESILETE
jgi:AcrR family transcriptional regulator